MRLGPTIAALVAVTGCSGGATAWLPSPFESDVRSAVLGVGNGANLRVYAFDVADTKALEVPDIAENASIEVLAYGESLDGLRLPELELRPSVSGSPLPAPAATYRMTLDGANAGVWRAASMPSPDLTEFRTDRTASINPCNDIDIEVLTLSATTAATAIVEVEPGVVWIAMDQTGRFFVYDGATIVEADVTPTIRGLRDVTLGPDGNLYAVAVNPRAIYRGRPQGTTLSLEVVTTTIGQGRPSRIAVGPDMRVVVMSRSAKIWTIDGGAAAQLYDFGGLDTTDDNALYFDDDVLYAATEQIPAIARLVPERSPVTLSVRAGGLSIGRTAFGLTVGTIDADVFTFDIDRFEPLTTFDFIKVRTVFPLGDHLITSGNTGAVGVYDGTQSCVTGLETLEDLAAGARLGDDAYVYVPTSNTDRVRAGGDTPMTVVRRVGR